MIINKYYDDSYEQYIKCTQCGEYLVKMMLSQEIFEGQYGDIYMSTASPYYFICPKCADING